VTPHPLLLAAALAAAACGGRREARVERALPADRAVVSLASVAARTGPSPKDPVAVTLARGTELQIRGGTADFYRVVPPSGMEVWVPAGSFERLPEKSAREARAAAVAGFPAQPGSATEPSPVLLAPDYGAARWGSLQAGDTLDVLLADHDFFGVRLAGGVLAFVPARSVHLLPSAPPTPSPQKGRDDAVLPAVTSLEPEAPPAQPPAGGGPSGLLPGGGSGAEEPAPAGVLPPGESALRPESPLAAEPFESVPVGGEPPVLLSRVEARYPEVARRMNLEGEVVLRAVVERTGRVGRIEVVSGGPGGMTAAAVDAARRWVYEPGKVNGRPVAMVKTMRVRFLLRPGG
jgi:TonB family protein